MKKTARRALSQNGGEPALGRGVNERAHVEQALRESEQRFRATFEQAAVGIAHTTSAGKFLEINEKLCAMLGYSRDELMRMTTLELSPPSDAGQHAALYQEVIDGKRERFSAEKRWQRGDGTFIWVNRTVSRADGLPEREPYLIQVIEDITDRKRTEARLDRANRAQRVLAECSHALVRATNETQLLDDMCRIVAVTGGFPEAWIGLAVDDAAKSIVPAACVGIDRGYLEGLRLTWATDARYPGIMGHVIAAGKSYVSRNINVATDRELHYLARRARSRGMQSLVGLPLVVDGRCIGGINVYSREPDAFDTEELALLSTLADDIAFGIQSLRAAAAKKEAEAHLTRVTRARRVITECNRAQAHATDENRMLAEMCRIAVESGGYNQSWIGLPTGDPMRPVHPVAYSGYGDDAPMTAAVTWTSDGRYKGLAAEALAFRETRIVRDLLNDPLHERMRERALQLGYQSSIALLLRDEGAVIGVLVLHAAERDAFDADEIILLEEVAEDIALGITSLRERIARRIAEAALHESEQRFRETFEQAAVGITRVDLNGVLEDVNQKFCDMLGYGKDELLGKHIRDITHPEDYGRGAQYRAELTHRVMKSAAGEKRFIRKDGTVLWGRRTMSTACDASGKPLYVISVVEDIAERKELERRFELTFNHAAVGMVQASLDGRLMQVNQKYADLLGYTREELQGMSSNAITHPEDLTETLQTRTSLIEGRLESASNEKRLVRKDGRVIWVNRTVSVARDPAGAPLYFITIVEDISGRKEAEAERAQLAAIVEGSDDAIISTTLERKVLTWNAAAERMFGYTAAEVIGQVVSFLIPPDREGEAASRRMALDPEKSMPAYDTVRIAKDGHRIDVSITQSPIKDADGRVLGVSLMFRDITARRQAEERYRATFDSAPVGIMHTTIEDNQIVQVNPKLCEMLGFTRDELLGRLTDEILHPDYRGKDRTKYREAMLNGKLGSFSSERVFVRKDGSSLWVNRTVSLVRDASGQPLYFIRIVEDVSARKQAEEAVAREHALLRAVVDAVPDAIYVKDREGRYLLHNTANARTHGAASPDELLGKTAFDIFPHPIAESISTEDRAMMSSGAPVLERVRDLVDADGVTRWLATSKFPLRGAAEEVIGIVGVNRDITERTQSERRRAMEHAVTSTLAEAVTIDEALPRVIRTICEALDWTCGFHWSWDRPAELLRCQEHWYKRVGGIENFVRASLNMVNEAPSVVPAGKVGGLVRKVWVSGEPVWISDVMAVQDFRRAPAAAQAGLHSAFGFPVLSEGHPVGIMEFFSNEIRQPDEALLQGMRAIGSQIGLFIQRKDAEQALRKSEERYRDVFESSPLPLWVWDDETLAIVDVNQAAVDHYGYSRDEFLRMNVRDVWAAGEAERYEENISKRTQEQSLLLQRRHRTRDGRVIDVEVTARRIVLAGRQVWLTLINDITDRKRAEAALRESEEQFRQLAGNIPQVFWICDARQHRAIYISSAYREITGLDPEKLTARAHGWLDAVHPEDREQLIEARKDAALGRYDQTFRILKPDGSVRWVRDRAFPVHDAGGSVYRIAGICEDISEKRAVEERLAQLAHYDNLTDLPNRALYLDRMKQAMVRARRHEELVGILFVDLDRFKLANDTFGHAIGDQLLKRVAERLVTCVRASDTVGRFGGDEFGLVLADLRDAEDARLVAQKILTVLEEPFELEGRELFVTASIGISLCPTDSDDETELMKNADAAMYRAKESGRNRYEFYSREMNARSMQRLDLESKMRRALERSEFLLHYQPKASLATGRITGFEALLRWQQGQSGLLSPGEFVPLLEDTGLIVPVGEWVIDAVCRQLVDWRKAGVSLVPVAINLSARQFKEKNFGGVVERILRAHDIDPRSIELEITESSLMVNTEEVMRTLCHLKALGLRLSIDDFGTGYSSLGYLRRFPLDTLKIDRSFVNDITTDAGGANITRAVISMAHNLGLNVVAEGVETEAQLAFLCVNGCGEMQGYYFSRPLSVADSLQWLREKRTLRRPAAAIPAARRAPR